MMLSHHAPVDYDRTVRILNVRICSRCLGVFLGMLSGWFAAKVFSDYFHETFVLIIIILLPLPAVFDFLANELKRFSSDNMLRFTTGILLGIPAGVSLSLLSRSIYFMVLLILWYAVIELLAALVLRAKGHLDDYMKKYSAAVTKMR